MFVCFPLYVKNKQTNKHLSNYPLIRGNFQPLFLMSKIFYKLALTYALNKSQVTFLNPSFFENDLFTFPWVYLALSNFCTCFSHCFSFRLCVLPCALFYQRTFQTWAQVTASLFYEFS